MDLERLRAFRQRDRVDVLRDHRRSDLRHDRDDRRVRYSVNRRGHRVMVDHPVNRRSDLRDDDHRLPLDDRHRMDYLGVDDLKLGVSLDVSRDHRMNAQLGGHLMGASRVNRNCARHDLMTDGNLDVSLCHRMNDLLDDRNLDDDLHDQNLDDDLHDQNLVVNLLNRSCVLRDQNLDVNLVVSRGLRMNDLLDDHSMGDGLMKGANHDHRMSVMGDRNDLMMVVNLLNRNCALHDQNLDAKMGGNLYPRMNVMDDLNLDASRANRNCALHDQMKDVNLDAMSHL